MKRVTGFLILASAAFAGCGTDVDPQASGVFPSEAFIGRKVRVEISGDQTNWSSGATVSFGDGITVDSVSVASPSALFVDLTIAPSAAPGLHDVVVTDGGDKLTLTQAFELVTPTKVSVQGTLAQGSVAFLTITNLDFFNQFDATTDADGNFVNTTLTGPAGTSFQINTVDAFSISAAMLIDVDAQPGAFTINSGIGETAVTSPGDTLDIAPRTPVAIESGTPAQGNQVDPFASALYEFTPTAGPAAVTAVATSNDDTASPQMVILAPSGHFSDGFRLFPITGFFGDVIRAGLGIVEKTPEKFYAVYLDLSGAAGYQYQIRATSTTLTAANEVGTAHATNATAQALTAPAAMVDNGSLTSEAEVDMYKIPVTAAQVGKKVHVITVGGDPLTDTVVEVFGGTTGTTSLGGESDDADFGEDFVSGAVPAGTTNVFVKISASQAGFFDPAHNAYLASIVFE
ncbi:MAG TPA: hypothetical protein VFQ53_06875 [Kofleriaceae bacterium]|nr:hypothetical protein [Kofleriaceae bacterium]